jgi:hypothetical protein
MHDCATKQANTKAKLTSPLFERKKTLECMAVTFNI